MIRHNLGETVDIHCGGSDLVFPHHENEIAQSACCSGAQLAGFWLHNGLIKVDGYKMSKSSGNVLTVSDLLGTYHGEAVRFALMSGHYRSDLSWTQRAGGGIYEVHDAERQLAGLYDALDLAGSSRARADPATSAAFVSALDDDLNFPRAIAELHGMADRVRSAVAAGDSETAGSYSSALRESGEILGILQDDPSAWFRWLGSRPDANGLDADRIDKLVARRRDFRSAGSYAAADEIRQTIASLGIELLDSASGTKWRLKW